VAGLFELSTHTLPHPDQAKLLGGHSKEWPSVFNIEDTHLTDLDRINKLLALVIFAFI